MCQTISWQDLVTTLSSFSSNSWQEESHIHTCQRLGFKIPVFSMGRGSDEVKDNALLRQPTTMLITVGSTKPSRAKKPRVQQAC